VLGDELETIDDAMDYDPTSVDLDRNYEYSIWLSYAEVYNEKIYDLLASASPDDEHDIASRLPRPAGAPPAPAHPLLLKRKALSLKPSPPADAYDDETPGCTGKYVAGLRHVRVKNSKEAKAVVRTGQLHRRVFGTLANSQSSRSHGVVTIKILKQHRGEKNVRFVISFAIRQRHSHRHNLQDPTAIQTSRLTIVDLAGSERTKHTQTTGERLKEAGNINKSLMVLGQCMEVMRTNQRKVAQSLAVAGR
jgi:kinesin family member 20